MYIIIIQYIEKVHMKSRVFPPFYNLLLEVPRLLHVPMDELYLMC